MGSRKSAVQRDDKNGHRADLLLHVQVQGDDVTPFCKVKVSYRFLPSGFFFSWWEKRELVPPPAHIQREWGVLSLCCSCNTSCRKDVEVNWFQKHWLWLLWDLRTGFCVFFHFFFLCPELLQMFPAIVFQAVVQMSSFFLLFFFFYKVTVYLLLHIWIFHTEENRFILIGFFLYWTQYSNTCLSGNVKQYVIIWELRTNPI